MFLNIQHVNFHTIPRYNALTQYVVICSLSHSRDPLFYILQRTDFHYFSIDRERTVGQPYEIGKGLGFLFKYIQVDVLKQSSCS